MGTLRSCHSLVTILNDLFSAKLRGKGRPKKKRTAAGKMALIKFRRYQEDALTSLFRIRIPVSKEEEIDVSPPVVNRTVPSHLVVCLGLRIGRALQEWSYGSGFHSSGLFGRPSYLSTCVREIGFGCTIYTHVF